MTRKQEIQTQIANLQAELTVLNRAPSDTYPFGTVVVFASGTGGATKWYYRKVAEETWESMVSTPVMQSDLASWIAYALESGIGYFEVYVLTVAPSPIFASA